MPHLFLLLACVHIQTPQPEPNKLATVVTWYPNEFVGALASSTLDRFTYWDAEPLHLVFPTPEQVEIHWGQETTTCTACWPTPTQLQLDCGAGPRQVHWDQYSATQVNTDVFQVLGQPGAPQSLVAQPEAWPELASRLERDEVARQLASLTGEWRDSQGIGFLVGPDGTAWSPAGTGQQVSLVPCLVSTGEDSLRTICMPAFDAPEREGLAWMSSLPGWQRGFWPDGLTPDGRTLILESGGDVHRRVSP